MSNKRNVVLYLDKELVEKTRNLGLNLSKTFENHLKHLLTHFSTFNSVNNCDSASKSCDWWAGPDLNRRPLARKAPESALESESELLERFRDFQMVDLRRSKRTAYEKVWFIKKLLGAVCKKPTEISREDLRCYLKSFEKLSAATYKNALMALKVFFRDFLEMPEVVSSFKFPHQVFKPKQILSKEQLQQFYKQLETPKKKALFLLYATTGLRRDEILSLRPEDIDFEKRMITPNNHCGETKKHSRSQRLFPMQRDEVVGLWKSAREKTGIDITPQK